MSRYYPANTNGADTRDRASATSGFLSGHEQFTVTGVFEIVNLGTASTAVFFNATNQLSIGLDGSDNIVFDVRNGDNMSFAASEGTVYRFVLDYSNTSGTIQLYVNSTTATDTGAVADVAFTDTPNWQIGSSDATDGVDIRWHELAFVTGRITTSGERTSIMAATSNVYDNIINEVFDFSAEETAGRGTAWYDMRDGTESMLERTNNATLTGPDFDTLGWRGSPQWDSADAFTLSDTFEINLFHKLTANGSTYNLGSMPASSTVTIPLVLSNTSGSNATGVSISVTSGIGEIITTHNTISNGANELAELEIAVPASGGVTSTITVTSDDNPNQTLTITGTARSETSGTVGPHADWDGTAGSGFDGSGEATPTENASVYGSGFTKQVAGLTDLAQDNGFFYTEENTLVVGAYADHGDIGWIDRVEWYVEGTKSTVYLPSWSERTNAAGFLCEINPAGDGVVRVYAKIIPVNGYERQLGPIDIFFNPNLTLADETFELAASGGGDFTTLESACNGTNPAAITIINITEAGTYTQTNPFTDNEINNGFPTIIKNTSGGNVKIGVSDTTKTLRIRHDWLWFDNIIFPYNPDGALSVSECYGAGGDDGWWGFNNCSFVDETYGAVGPRIQDGNVPYDAADVNSMFRSDQGFGTYNCTFNNANGCIGVDAAIKCTISHSYDGFYGSNDRIFIGNTVNAYEGQVRYHQASELTVASASYNGGSGQTTITLQTAPNWQSNNTIIADEIYFYVTSGSLVDQIFDLRDTTNGDDATPTIVVDGDASSLNNGDTALAYIIPHGDGIQWIETGDYDNTVMGYCTVQQSDGEQWMQWILAQSGDAGSITNSAIFMTRFIRDTVGGATGQLQDNIDHCVFRNITTEGVGTVENGVISFDDVYFIDSALASESTSNSNTTMFNCHTSDEDNAAAQGNLGTGPTDFDITNGVPSVDSPLYDRGYWNRLRYDLAGNAIDQTSISIGALQFSIDGGDGDGDGGVGDGRSLFVFIPPQHQRPPGFTLNGESYLQRRVNLRAEEMIANPQIAGPVTVAFEDVDPDYEIRYTTSNRNPAHNSILYSGPFQVRRNLTGSDNTVIKARIYRKGNPNITTRIIKIQFRLY